MPKIDRERCMWCKFFHVPDDDQEWASNGVCEYWTIVSGMPSVSTMIIFDSMNNDIAHTPINLHRVIVKQWYYCDRFIGDVLKYELANRKEAQ